MRYLISHICLLSALLMLCVHADTEILNFGFPLPSHPTIYPPLTSLIYTISPYETLTMNLTDTSSERWFALDLGDIKRKGYKGWTLRASWPGSSPTKITLSEPISPGYFTLKASPLSPRFPYHPHLLNRLPDFISIPFTKPIHREEKSDKQFETLLNLTLEPLWVGVLPYTALPAVGMILLFAIGALWSVPYFIQGLEAAGNHVAGRQSTSQKID